MNPINFFKFLEKTKGKPIPLKVKLLYDLPLTPEELNIDGELDLIEMPITSLPDGLKIRIGLWLSFTPITSLPDGLEVGFNLGLDNCENLTSLPDGLKVGGSLWLHDTPIKFLPKDLQLEDDLYIANTPLAEKYTDEQIRKMAPGVKGKIYR